MRFSVRPLSQKINMASDEDKDTLYCICRQPYNENEFMIECDICKDWFHGSCVGILEHQAPDIEIYHCPNCQSEHGPLVLKQRRNWHRHDYSDSGATKAVQTGTVVFIKELKGRTFPSADEIPVLRLPGHAIGKMYFDKHGFDVPILFEGTDGLGMTLPPPTFSIQDVEDYVGSMREIDVIDVSRQEDYKMLMREWTEYYSSPNRNKIFNVISLEFSKTKMSDLVTVPEAVREVSWVSNGVWPETLPDDCTYTKPEVHKYCLMGVRDSFTDFHIDFGGTSVWYHVLRGEKVFFLIRPTTANLCLYETWLSASNQSELFFGDQVDKCYKCVVKQGHTVFIPTGWIHAVFTPIDSLVFGGNFLHSYNIPLQLEVYAIEKRVKTSEKYLFPSYETINWYAAKQVLDVMRDYIDEGKKPPAYIFEGAKALVFHLRSWTQRKDFIKSAKHDVPEHIQYGRLLKELGKDVKACEDPGQKSSTPRARVERKRKKKKKEVTKKIEGLDILDMHTQSKLEEMKRERKNIYNFEEDEDSSQNSRLPKAGAFTDSSGNESPDKLASRHSLTLKVSNGKIVSERKAKKGEFQPFVGGSDKDDSEEESLVVDENPSKARKTKQPKLKLKLSFHHPPSSSNTPATETESKSHDRQSSQPSQFSPKSPTIKQNKSPAIKQNKSPTIKQNKSPTIKQNKSPTMQLNHPPTSRQTITVPPISTLLPPKSEPITSHTDLSALASSRTIKSEPSIVKSDLTLSDIINQSALKNNSQSTIGKVEPLSADGEGESSLEQELRRNIPTIRGGLNGSIADILEASGYGTETAFTVDEDVERAPSPSMREAIQGMLSMSRGGLGGMQLFSRAESRRQGIRSRSALAEEDEEEKLSKCYQDDEFVYPTLEMDEDEQDQVMRGQSKQSKDSTWNPKARVNISVPLGERSHREGVTKESVKNSLEQSAAKITSAPKVKRPYKKKPKLDIDSIASTSSSFLSPTHSGSAFRPGVNKVGGSLSDSANKRKKPKKGEATAKQRLGKILKIHKMGMH